MHRHTMQLTRQELFLLSMALQIAAPRLSGDDSKSALQLLTRINRVREEVTHGTESEGRKTAHRVHPGHPTAQVRPLG